MVVRLVIGAVFSLIASPAAADDWLLQVYSAASGPGASLWSITQPDDSSRGRGAGVATYWNATPWLQIGADVMTSTSLSVEPGDDEMRTSSLMAAGRLKMPLGKADMLFGLGYGVVDVMYDNADTAEQPRVSATAVQASVGASVPVGDGALFGEIKHQAFTARADRESAEQSGVESDYAVVGYQFNF